MKYIISFIVASLILTVRPIFNGLCLIIYYLYNFSLPKKLTPNDGWSYKQQQFKDKFFYVSFNWKYSVEGYVYMTFWDFVMCKEVLILNDNITPEIVMMPIEVMRNNLLVDLKRDYRDENLTRKQKEAYASEITKLLNMSDDQVFYYYQNQQDK